MHIRRSLACAAATGLLGAVATAGPSLAQPNYPPTGTSVSVSSSSVDLGNAVTLDGTGFRPSTLVTITSSVTLGGTSIGPLSGRRSTPDSSVVQSRAMSAAFYRARDRTLPRVGSGHRPDRSCSTGRVCYARVDASGSFSIPFTLTRPGTTTIRVRGIGLDGEPHTVTATVTVAGGGSTGSGPVRPQTGEGGLASTGTPMLGMLAAALLLVTAGAGLTVVSRRRRRAPSASGPTSAR